MSRHVTRFPAGFDYDFRPESYFDGLDPNTLLLVSILGEERRKIVAQHLKDGSLGAEVALDWMIESKLDDDVRKRFGAQHPSFMGGEYLPALGDNEIEIARVVFASLMQDVISIRARKAGQRILYSVQDEYATKFVLAWTSSRRPLTLRGLIKFIDGSAHPEDEFGPGLAWPHIIRHVEDGFVEDAQGLVSVESDFYPQLGPYYQQVIDDYFEALDAERRRQDAIVDGEIDELSAEEPKTGKLGGQR